MPAAGPPTAPTCAACAGAITGSRPSPGAGGSPWIPTERCTSPARPASPAPPGHRACTELTWNHRRPPKPRTRPPHSRTTIRHRSRPARLLRVPASLTDGESAIERAGTGEVLGDDVQLPVGVLADPGQHV